MATHQDLLAWQVATENALAIHRDADQHWSPARAAVYDQLRRASLSVPVNIAEGHAFGPGRRYKSHLRIAIGSAVETTDLLQFLHALDGGVDDLIERSFRVRALTFRLWQRTPE